MRRAILCVLLLGACQPTPKPSAIPPAKARRVVLLSLDGFAAQRHAQLLQQGAYRHPQGLQAFWQQGWVVEQALAPNPTLTSVSHATIATGRWPQEHGIVANRFHLPHTPLGATVSGFEVPWEAKPLWARARRQGKKVGVVTFPGCDGSSPQRTADFFMVYVNTPWVRPRFWRLPVDKDHVSLAVTAEKSGETWTFPLTLVREPSTGRWLGLRIGQGSAQGPLVQVGQWFPLTLTRPHEDGGRQTVGAWCLLQELDQGRQEVVLYQGGFYALEAFPRPFRQLLEERAGFWPGPPDDEALKAGLAGEMGLSLEAYHQQLARFARFFTNAALAAIQTVDFDLLLAYQPIVDEAQHALLVEDPRQAAFSPGLQRTSQEFLDGVYQLADEEVGKLATALDFSRDALVVVSDHGMPPVWAQLNLQELFTQQGLCPAREEKGKRFLDPACKLWVVPGGGVAHVYLNLSPADPMGLAQAKERQEVLLRAMEELAKVTVAGEPALEAAAEHKDLGAWGLAHPHSGDLVVFAQPGVLLGGRLGDPLLSAPPYWGAHGYLNHHPSMAAVFMARGAGVPRQRQKQSPLTQVVPLVAQLLGLAPAGP